MTNTSYVLEDLKIEVTHKCMLSCVHCSNYGSQANNKAMSIEKCINIIGEASTMGVKRVSFSGGEPIIWPFIEQAVEVAHKKSLVTTIFTSGYANDTKSIIYKLKIAGLDRIIFSIYSATDIDHERITRKKGSFNCTKAALSYSNSIGLETELHFVAMSNNYDQLTQVVEFANINGASAVSVLRFAPQGRGALIPEYTLNKEQNINLQANIIKLKEQGYNIRTGTPLNFLLVNNVHRCNSGINKLTIDPDYKIYPCDGFKNISAKHLVGTVDFSSLENESLVNCWHKSPYLQHVRDYLKTDFKEPCASCTSLGKCMSGCTAQKVLEYGKLVSLPDPDCLFH